MSTYTPIDIWTNLGLQIGIDNRKISSGLGHSCVEVTQMHYGQIIQEKKLNENNTHITKQPESLYFACKLFTNVSWILA